MRFAALLVMIPLAGCSLVLGIEDPSPGSRIDAAVDGADAPSSDRLMFSVGDFQLAQLQSVRVHVMHVHRDGTMEDVTTTATYKSDNELLVAIGGPGVINSVDSQSGSATITASLAGSTPATVKATVKTTLCHPVINELLTATTASPDEEWVEVYNPCTVAIDVSGWTLDYRGANTTGTTDSVLMVTLANQMAPGEIRLFGSMVYAGTKDGMWPNSSGILGGISGAVGLRDGPISIGLLVDSVGYGTVASLNPFLESTAAPAMSANVSASRLPFDGKDDDDGITDFKITQTPTPRALNVP